MTPDEEKRIAKQVNSPTLIIGISGSGKTSLIATYAIWIWKTWGRVTLLYSSDGGGFPAIVQELIERGIIRVWRLRTRSGEAGELAFETCQRATQGYFPAEIDPHTGETQPFSRLVAPLTQSFAQHCSNGHLVKSVPYRKLLTPTVCPTCKEHVTASTQRVEAAVSTTKGFENVGGVAYDSLTSMCSWGMSDLAHRVGTRQLKGEEGSIGGKVDSGDLAWGANNRSHYGFTQQRAEEFATNSQSIPGLVAPPLFTALTQETTERGGLPIVGPELSGQAKTATAPQWFGNCFESTKAVDTDNKEHFRLYLSEWIDEHNRRHLCKHRGGPIGVPKYVQDPADTKDDAQPFSIFNLGYVFDLLTASRQLALSSFSDVDLEKTPGIAQSPTSYGAAQPAAPVAAAAPKATATPKPRARRPVARAKPPAATPAQTPTQTPTQPPAKAPIQAPAQTPSPTPTAPPLPLVASGAPGPLPAPVPRRPTPVVPPQSAPAQTAAARPAVAAPAMHAGPASARRPAPPPARPPKAAPRRRATSTTAQTGTTKE